MQWLISCHFRGCGGGGGLILVLLEDMVGAGLTCVRGCGGGSDGCVRRSKHVAPVGERDTRSHHATLLVKKKAKQHVYQEVSSTSVTRTYISLCGTFILFIYFWDFPAHSSNPFNNLIVYVHFVILVLCDHIW